MLLAGAVTAWLNGLFFSLSLNSSSSLAKRWSYRHSYRYIVKQKLTLLHWKFPAAVLNHARMRDDSWWLRSVRGKKGGQRSVKSRADIVCTVRPSTKAPAYTLQHVGCISRMRLGQVRGIGSQISIQQTETSLIKPYLVSSSQKKTHPRDLCPLNHLVFGTGLTPSYLHPSRVHRLCSTCIHYKRMLTRRRSSFI